MIFSFPNYTQLDAMDCGPSCLRMIAKYYGRNYSLQTLREKSFITRQGVSLLAISEAAESIGFRTQGLKLNIEQLIHEMTFPCILHWNENHFVVCYRVRKKAGQHIFMISDPDKGKYEVRQNDFCKSWLTLEDDGKKWGIALFLTPSPLFYEQDNELQSQERNLSYFWNYLSPYKSQLFQLIIGLLLGSVFSVIFPFLTQAIVDQGIANNNLHFVTLVLIAQLVLSATQTSVTFLQSWITLHMNARISIALISDFLLKLMKLPLRFFDTKYIGDIMQRIGDHNRIQTFMTSNTLSIVFSFFNFVVFSCILAYYESIFLFVFLLGNILYILWIVFFMRYRRRLDNARFINSSINQSKLVQMITGMQEIKLNNCERQQRWQWENIQVKLFKISVKNMALGQVQQLGSIFFSQTTNLLISFLSAKAVIEGNITLGMMMSVSYIIGQLSIPIGQVISFMQSFQDAKISLERLNEIHKNEDEEKTTIKQLDELPEYEYLSLENLCFNYTGLDRDYLLENLNLKIPRYKVTAIVGASGSGKTTIIKLLLGFYLANKGTVKIGEVNLNDINPRVWRQHVGAVLQDGFIFSDTIANNIAVGVETIDKKRLLHAVELTNLRNFIETLPLKYNTKIGMDGNGISQGQKQRLLIARAIYKNPDFLFFDEATNALDAYNEQVIMRNLNEFYKGKTVVVVAHRLSTVQNADNIVVLDCGKIIEEGTHCELLARKGEYYRLIKNQLELGL